MSGTGLLFSGGFRITVLEIQDHRMELVSSNLCFGAPRRPSHRKDEGPVIQAHEP